MAKLHLRLSLMRRDRELADHYAEKLSELGFEVEGVSDRGITFEGDKPQIEEIFNTTILKVPTGYAFDAPPELPKDIREHVASVYLPTQPSYFP
jgi:hypothetical protein